MRIPSLLAACLLPSIVLGQNLVKNGDFEARKLTPWVQAGPGVNAGVVKFDTNGTGASRSYAVSPGGNQIHSISQTVVVAPIPYELSVDLAVAALPVAFSLRLPQITIKLDNDVITSHTFMLSRVLPTRRRLCAHITPKKPGSHTLIIEIVHGGIANNRSPRVYVDNVDFRVARNPMFCIRGERKLGTSMNFDVEGSKSAPFVVFLAPSLLPKRIQIPGIGGELALDPTILTILLAGKLDASGKFSWSATVPVIRGLAGVRLYWQGLEVNSKGPTLGWESMVGFY